MEQLVLFVVLIFTVSPTLGTLGWVSSRSNDFTPTKYNIYLRLITENEHPSGKQFTAPGAIDIGLTSLLSTDQIILESANTYEIDKESVKLTLTETHEEFSIKSFTVFENYHRQRVQIEFDPPTKPHQKLILTFRFVASIAKDCNTEAICYWEDGTSKVVVGPTGHGYTFPYHSQTKGTPFQLTILRTNDFNNTIGNSKIISSVPDPEYPGWTADIFENTEPIMPEHFTFVSSNFKFVERTFGRNDAPLRVHAPNRYNQINLVNVSDSTVEWMNAYESYFGDVKSHPKFDVVLLPTLRDVQRRPSGISIMPDTGEGLSSSYFVFQWLEDFYGSTFDEMTQYTIAEYVKNVVRNDTVNAVDEPKIASARNRFLKTHYHPEIKTPGQEDICIFPLKSYEKYEPDPKSMLQKLEQYLTKSTMRNGIVEYINPNNVRGNDAFWMALQKAAVQDGRLANSNLTVVDIVKSWTRISSNSYPVLHVSATADNQLSLSVDSKWAVPINVGKNGEQIVILGGNRTNLVLPISLLDWIGNDQVAWMYSRSIYEEVTNATVSNLLKSNAAEVNKNFKVYTIQDFAYFAENVPDSDIEEREQ